MTERKYTLSEIDRMRWSVAERQHFIGFGDRTALEKRIEAQLRTYMMAGIEPEELEKEAAAMRETRLKAKQESDAIYGSHPAFDRPKK